MSEGILKALMQLFALVSSPNQNEENRHNVVRDYLTQQLNNQRVEEYLTIYENFLLEQETRLKEKSRIKKRFAASSVKVLRIATRINEELTHYQKLIVIIQLLEFLNSGSKGIAETELEFANTIADTFNINSHEYLEIFAFITDDFKSQTPGNNVLIVSGKESHKGKQGYLYREHLRNELRILNIHSGNLLIIKSQKGSDLTINGQLIQPKKIHFMRPGSSLRHNRITPITYTDIASRFYKPGHKEPIQFNVDNILFKYAGSETGLHPLSFTSESGSLVGIMGDSGAGKTTLINLLTGIFTPQSGSVTINGQDIHENQDKTKGLIGYVSQDDLLMEDLTVYQNLFFNAQLCFDHLTTQNIRRKVLSLLKTLGLYEIRDMKVGSPLDKKISGGQRKRLNIALELIREPAVMFMDEPTSGLSSRDSENIMDLLKELALKGKLIFVVIHQPSSDIFKMFDQLLVLDSGGYLIYNGDAVEAINFFKGCINHINRDESECPLCGNVSPEQILTIINNHVLDEYGNPTDTRKVTAEEWYQTYNNSLATTKKQILHKPEELPEISFHIPNRIKQFFIFLKRDVYSKLANKQYLVINLLESPMLAIILASMILYFDVGADGAGSYIFFHNPNLTVYIIIAVIIAIFIGLSVSAEEIINDRKILKREAFLDLSRLSYLFSKVFILAILSAIQTGLFVLVGNSIMQIENMGMAYWMMLFSSAVFANLLGLNISDSFKKTVNIYILIPFLIIPQLILSGVFVSYDQLNPKLSSTRSIPWYGELITARWAFEGLAVHQFKNNEYQQQFYVFERLKSQATYKKDFWYSELHNLSKRLTRVPEKEQQEILKLFYNEFTKLNKREIQDLDFDTSRIFTATLNDEFIMEIQEYLNKVRTFYINLYNRADEAHENRRRSIIDNQGNEYLTYLRNKHHNDNLERFVRRSNDIFANRVIRYDNQLIQKFDPIYMDPKFQMIKAHFLAPTKNIGNRSIDTFWFNLAVIWIYNISLFILLYAGLFRKGMNKSITFKNKITKKADFNT
ncbi:ATP-binding cassette domain-containing protein [Alkalitalea saponilacus]|uniref:ABC-type multidrug transport system, ATPase component n=1 Tax=Alkalitalea saponilacus TaxID=889453 RepID=A0A1T5HA41_9BACT|nr:ATP-binding cassette domain-containing protein [Alkalitalea saponilacus]ASB50804.1 ABC transporter [Alkalitalea saponilacus]SKC17563.1 ABC-type multidrug transport system, ATPase component [Alkalitalea saponilacus]